jgi:AcrR family transcriptional regulator
MNSDDKRVRRSRRLMGDALLQLLQGYDLSTITVRAVTDAADVGYMTFYRHYESLDDLLVDRIRSIIEEQIDRVIMECDQQGELIFRHIAENAALYRTLLFNRSAAQARQKLAGMLAEFFLLTVRDDPLIPNDLQAQQMAAGVLSLVSWWFEKGMEIPIDKMAVLYNRLILDENVDQSKIRALASIHPHAV